MIHFVSLDFAHSSTATLALLCQATLPHQSSTLAVTTSFRSARTGPTMYEIMAGLEGLNPSVRMIATGSGQGDEMALRALCAEAKGFIDESARAEEFRRRFESSTADRFGHEKCSTRWSLGTPIAKSAKPWGSKSAR